MSLATKYRPQEFSSVCEQDTIINIVSRLCEQENLENRNFLFIGPAGCGKTTTARIMAKVLNEGKENSTIEMDAASHNGVESVREIINQARMYPVGTKYKVFIIDECHAFSPQAWQIWLKPLEDAPAKSIYIFCLDKDSLVPSENGLKKISELSPGEKVWTGEKYDVISNVFNNGKKPCIKLKLRNGQSITCTKNHEILVLRGDKETWVSAGDVSVGDNILVYTNIDTNCLNNKLDISESEAFFLGYLTGNGSYTSHDMHLYTPPKKWDRLQPILDELVSQGVFRDYLKQSDLNTTDNVLVTRIYFPKNGMNLWYNKVGADPNYTRGTKSIPKCVYSMDDNLFRSFVDGWYFADGCGRFDSFYDRKRGSGGYSAYLYSNSPSLIYDLQNLLLYHGYYSTVSKHESIGEITPGRTLEDKVVVSYAIYLRYQYGNFLNDDFARILKSKYDEMPRGKYLLDLSNIKQYPVRKITPQMLRDAGYGYFVDKGAFDTVVAIEDAGIKEVYDLEVPETSSFICNGIKVHNCTTNPEKIPATIISRVQTFQLSKISLKGIFDRLCYIIEQENKEGAGITYTDDAVNYISKLASGGMRDAITNLDKVLAFTHDLTSESVAKALNLPEYDDYFKLLAAYSKKDNKIVSEVINDVYNSGVNFVKWFEGFHSFVMNVVKYIFLQDINLTMIPSHYQSKISKYGTAHSVVCLKLANKLLKLNYELKTTQYLQEVALTYLCQLPKKGE